MYQYILNSKNFTFPKFKISIIDFEIYALKNYLFIFSTISYFLSIQWELNACMQSMHDRHAIFRSYDYPSVQWSYLSTLRTSFRNLDQKQICATLLNKRLCFVNWNCNRKYDTIERVFFFLSIAKHAVKFFVTNRLQLFLLFFFFVTRWL